MLTFFAIGVIGLVVALGGVLFVRLRATDRRCQEQGDRLVGELGRLQEALVTGGQVERMRVLPAAPAGPPSLAPLTCAALVPAQQARTVEAPVPSRPAFLPAPRPEATWIEKRAAQLTAGGMSVEAALLQAREEGLSANASPGAARAPRAVVVREKNREELLRDRFESLARMSPEAAVHCSGERCGHEAHAAASCRCACPGCARASRLFRQAVDELGPSSTPRR